MKKHLYEIKRLDIPAYLKWWFIKYRNAGTLSEVLENLTSPITLTNSLKRKFKIFEIGGKSEQETFTGKNIVKSLYYRGASTLNFYINEKKVVSSMIISGITNVSVNNITVYLKFGNVTYTLATFNMVANQKFNVSITLTEEQINAIKEAENVYIQLYRPSASSADLSTCTYDEMMLRDSSTTDTYEEYVGGQPAPNPNYECPIQNVTGNVEVKVENKNILNLNVEGILANGIDTAIKKDNNIYFKTNTKYVASYRIPVKYKLNEPMTISFDAQFLKTLDIPNHNSIVYFRKGNMTKGTISLRNNTNKNSYYITLEEGLDEEGYTFWIYLKTIQTYEAKEAEIQFENLQIEYGTKATTPVPHEEQTVAFPLAEGQVLHEGDTIEDKIVQRRKTISIDITKFTATLLSSSKILILTNIRSQIGYYKNINGLCSHFVNANNEQIKDNGSAATYLQDGQFNFRAGTLGSEKDRIYFKNSSFTTLADWTNFFTNNNVVLEYVLNEPIEIPFTQAQATAKAQIDSLHSYKGTTYISSANDPSPLFTIQYVKEET